jgi:hypothetical protein
MGAGKYVAPDYTTQSGTVYPLGIDKTLAILRRLAAQFNPSAQDVPDMTVRVDAGTLYQGTTLTEVAAQNTVTITAPSVNPRIDRVVLDPANGVVTVIAGVESATPVPPAIISGFLPICQIALATSTTQIGDSLITDERQALMLFISAFVWTLLDDADADAFIETLADGATAEASPAVGDFALISDITANDGRKSTLQNIFDLLLSLANTFTGNNTFSGNDTFSGTKTLSGAPIEFAEGAAVASAATTDIWGGDDGNTVHVTGTTTITSFGTAPQAGAMRWVIFDGALILTHGANLNIPGGLDHTTIAGDACLVYADTTTQLNVIQYSSNVVPFSYADKTAQETAANPARAVAPATQQFHPSAAKAWAVFNAAGTLLADYNVDSVTDIGVGRWDPVLTVDMSSTSYAADGSGFVREAGANQNLSYGSINRAVGSYELEARSSAGGLEDPSAGDISTRAFGDQ